MLSHRDVLKMCPVQKKQVQRSWGRSRLGRRPVWLKYNWQRKRRRKRRSQRSRENLVTGDLVGIPGDFGLCFVCYRKSLECCGRGVM